MPDWLAHDYQQRAFLVALVLGAVGAWFGVFVVQRKLAFMGAGLAHAAFGGAALGLLLQERFPGLDPLLTAVPVVLLCAVLVAWLRRRSELSEDTLIGILFAATMAGGIICLALKQQPASADAAAWLLGSVLGIDLLDLLAAGVLLLLALATIPLWSRWAFASFDEEMARADGLPVGRDDVLLALALGCTVVAAVKLVGVVLISAFLVIPAAAARQLVRSFAGMTVLAIAFGLLSSVVGLWASHPLDLPPGPLIVLTQALIFGGALVARE